MSDGKIIMLPVEHETFELILNGDEIDLLEMNRRDHADRVRTVQLQGYGQVLPDITEWKFEGRRVTGTQTRQFWLQRTGLYSCNHFAEVQRNLERGGAKFAEGQWREAFRRQYSQGRIPEHISFAGSFISCPAHQPALPGTHEFYFPVLYTVIGSGERLVGGFCLAGSMYYQASWLWLMYRDG